MKVHHHLRNLRRSFGSQPVVCVGRPSWSEAGIAAQVIPAQSSRWTSRGQGDVHCRLGDLATWRLADLPTCRRADLPTCRLADVPTCRLADLPTCRLADLPTWSWTTIGVPAHTFSVDRSSGVSSILNTKVGDIATSRPSSPRQPSQGPAIVRTSPTVSPLGAILLSLLPTGNSEEPRTFGVSSFSAIFNI